MIEFVTGKGQETELHKFLTLYLHFLLFVSISPTQYKIQSTNRGRIMLHSTFRFRLQFSFLWILIVQDVSENALMVNYDHTQLTSLWEGYYKQIPSLGKRHTHSELAPERIHMQSKTIKNLFFFCKRASKILYSLCICNPLIRHRVRRMLI